MLHQLQDTKLILSEHEQLRLAIDRISQTDLSPVYKIAKRTPLANFDGILVKREYLQPTGAYKIRGAALFIHNLPATVTKVVAASAGNYGQAIAVAAKKAGIESVIFMPDGAADLKVARTEAYGAKVITAGRNVDESLRLAKHYVKESGAVFAPPFDDESVIAGQSTIGHEIFEQNPDTKTILAAVGGGGLVSGLAIAALQHNPSASIIGVQLGGSNAMAQSLAHNQLATIELENTLADGTAVTTPGKLPFAICRELGVEVMTVTKRELGEAIVAYQQATGVWLEGAGALSLAGAKKLSVNHDTVAVLSGHNADPARIAELVGEPLTLQG